MPVDLFFYRDPEELEKAEEAQAFAAEQEQAQTWNASAGEAAPKEQPYSDPNAMAGFEQAPAAGGGFAAPAAPEQQWDPNAQAAGAAAQQWGARCVGTVLCGSRRVARRAWRALYGVRSASMASSSRLIASRGPRIIPRCRGPPWTELDANLLLASVLQDASTRSGAPLSRSLDAPQR